MNARHSLARIVKGCALAGFAGGGLFAVWDLWRRPFVLEFQAGSGSSWTEKVSAVAQSAALEGLGFAVLGLVFALLGASIAGRRAPRGRVHALQLAVAGAFFGWVSATWAAEDAFPFLTERMLWLLNAAGFIATLLAILTFTALARRLPWARRDAPVAAVISTLIAGGLASWSTQTVLLAESGGWRSSGRQATVAGILIAALLAAGLLTRLLAPTVERIGSRLAARPLLPPAAAWSLGLAFVACVLGSVPSVRMSPLPQEIAYERLPAPDETPSAPNVVLLTIDTLRADHLGCYGYDRPTSPFLDSVAAEGTRFAEPSAPASWTKPSTGTILTGLYPSRHGALYHGSTLRLPEGEQTLAEAFRERGYVTAGFVTNPNIKAVFDFDRGFDLYFDSPVQDTLTRACIRRTSIGSILMRLARHQFNWKYENDVRQMNRHVTAWLTENHEQPFFLYLHYIDPHIPYSPPREYREQFAQDHGAVFFNEREEKVGIDLYDGEIRYTDDGLRELVDEMRSLGVWEDTIFVVTSDHGEEFFEHGVLGHGYSLYEPVVQVPLIFRGPGIPAGRVVEQPVQILDMPATLLDAAGFEVDEFGDGRSFAKSFRDPLWAPAAGYFLENEFGQDDSNHRAFVMTGIREGRWKLVLTEQNAFFPPQNPAHGREALYDLTTDPGETTNLIAMEEHRPLVEELLERLQTHSQFLYANGFRNVKPAALTPDIAASLQALGYGE